MNFVINAQFLDTPHGNSTVWRYLGEDKFDWLLSNSALFFPSAARLSDQYEVTIPKSTLLSKRKHFESQGLTGLDLENELSIFHWEQDPIKELIFTSCWSLNQHESYALWKIYLGGQKNGVAIRTTVSALKRSILLGNDPYPEDFFISKVKYRSHLKPDELARLTLATTKKPFYDFERELRILILNYPISEGGTPPPYDYKIGRSVQVDLNELIHNVYISPFSDDEYKHKVERLLSEKSFPHSILKPSEIHDL